jgi:hypothetical protein
MFLGGCQLLTNFVRPLHDPPDAPLEDAGPDADLDAPELDAPEDDAPTEDAG